ncbi:DNA internalization-related competence protein ComEC/Rec2 [Dyella flava]|uniref:DNA internalization-related competence protein ComEC/Rec2 n=1 Tax=Dyella flava TaxID=1920170 RepID=A0ABS2K3R2_9GAMM|nr:DNA internalization-related competence protein ComEC/Rec2 [Dyella flava]MBM7125883.1 DNA internalization-related competence protein ComEC/Rec2 [Dyella flava]GLQ48600.1 DNA internalization-related competence protein ComEC/Rec2 [Dyella flava]
MQQTGTWPGAAVAALALLAGVLSVQWLPVLPSRVPMIALSVFAWIIAWRAPRWRWLTVVLLGFVWASWQGSLAMETRLPVAWEGQDFSATGRVEGLPQTRAGATSFLFRIEQAKRGDQLLPWQGLARLSWYGHPPPKLESCSRWQLLLRLRRPRGMLNPGGADGERSALARGIAAVGYVRDDSSNQLQAAALVCLDRLRASLAGDIQARVKDAHDAALLRAFTVGDTSGLSAHDWDVARANGISHLIAISGFHVGVAAVFGVWLCGFSYWLWPSIALRWPRAQAQAVAALAVAFAYAGLAGFGMPTVRTVLMIAAVALARCVRRATGAAQALALALMAILLADPLAVLEAGFWLSFVGVGFLILCLQTQGRGIRAFLHELTLGQIVMAVALLPLGLWFFGEASLVGALSNLVAVPFVSFVIVPCALIGLLLLLVCPPLATPPLWLAAWLTHAQWWLLEQTATWPGAHGFLPAVQPWALVLAMLGAAWLFMPRGVPLRVFGLLLFLPLLWPMRHTPEDGAFQAWVLDVGQGLSVIVRTGHHALVYDAGARYPSEFDLGEAVVIPSLHALGIDVLDVLMVSHADNDHAGGSPAVAAAFPAARLYGGEPDRMPIPVEQCVAGQQWEWDQVRFRVLSPAGAGATASDNDRSCVLLVEGRGGRLVLTGDIASNVEPRVAAGLGPGPPPVLQMPHHGSKTSSSPAFITAVKPGLTVVSAGWLNRFGHPRPEVLQRYAQAGVPVFNTAIEGAVQIDFPAAGPAFVAARWRLRERRYWRE